MPISTKTVLFFETGFYVCWHHTRCVAVDGLDLLILLLKTEIIGMYHCT